MFALKPGDRRRLSWRLEEDKELTKLVQDRGACNWAFLAEALHEKGFPLRSGKSCRLRWFNQLNPERKKGLFSDEEDRLITEAHSQLGNKWAAIARLLPGRTDNSIKNHWNATLSKGGEERRAGVERKPSLDSRPALLTLSAPGEDDDVEAPTSPGDGVNGATGSSSGGKPASYHGGKGTSLISTGLMELNERPSREEAAQINMWPSLAPRVSPRLLPPPSPHLVPAWSPRVSDEAGGELVSIGHQSLFSDNELQCIGQWAAMQTLAKVSSTHASGLTAAAGAAAAAAAAVAGAAAALQVSGFNITKGGQEDQDPRWCPTFKNGGHEGSPTNRLRGKELGGNERGLDILDENEWVGNGPNNLGAKEPSTIRGHEPERLGGNELARVGRVSTEEAHTVHDPSQLSLDLGLMRPRPQDLSEAHTLVGHVDRETWQAQAEIGSQYTGARTGNRGEAALGSSLSALKASGSGTLQLTDETLFRVSREHGEWGCAQDEAGKGRDHNEAGKVQRVMSLFGQPLIQHGSCGGNMGLLGRGKLAPGAPSPANGEGERGLSVRDCRDPMATAGIRGGPLPRESDASTTGTCSAGSPVLSTLDRFKGEHQVRMKRPLQPDCQHEPPRFLDFMGLAAGFGANKQAKKPCTYQFQFQQHTPQGGTMKEPPFGSQPRNEDTEVNSPAAQALFKSSSTGLPSWLRAT